MTEFPQPPVLTIPRHTPVRFVSGVLDAQIHRAVGGMSAVVAATALATAEGVPSGMPSAADGPATQTFRYVSAPHGISRCIEEPVHR